MTFQATVYRVLIISPKDVMEERKIIQEIISSWNRTYFSRMKALLLPVMLETYLVQGTSSDPNAGLNLQIAKDCDILIGAFWTRIGTDTGLTESSTLGVIEEFQKAGKPVMIYFSSVPVVPTSVDLKQYETLMTFMDDCINQGLVERYDSIPDFREKLSRQIASKMLKIQMVPEDETSRDPKETARKKSEEMVSKKFCDLIEGYISEWTKEKNSKPINYDDGKRILKNLTNEILSQKVALVGIFNKEIIKNIAEIMAKLNDLQKYRLYLDPKSYREFWKSGDEILASLDSIAGKVRKDMHGNTRSKE